MIAEQHEDAKPSEAAAESVTDQKARRGRQAITVFAFVWPVLCVGAALLYCQKKVEEVKGQFGSRPPIAIIDVNGDAMRMIESNPGMSGEDAAAKVYQKGAKLAEAGFVVLHKADLVAYPAEFEVKQ